MTGELLEDYEKLTEDELDEKINDILKKVEIAYAMGHEVALQQLLFHLEEYEIRTRSKT